VWGRKSHAKRDPALVAKARELSAAASTAIAPADRRQTREDREDDADRVALLCFGSGIDALTFGGTNGSGGRRSAGGVS
jgi:hypothetical protein